MTTRTLQGRHAVVTGGGRGIGLAIAGTLSGAGASVTVMGLELKRYTDPEHVNYDAADPST